MKQSKRTIELALSYSSGTVCVDVSAILRHGQCLDDSLSWLVLGTYSRSEPITVEIRNEDLTRMIDEAKAKTDEEFELESLQNAIELIEKRLAGFSPLVNKLSLRTGSRLAEIEEEKQRLPKLQARRDALEALHAACAMNQWRPIDALEPWQAARLRPAIEWCKRVGWTLVRSDYTYREAGEDFDRITPTHIHALCKKIREEIEATENE